MNVRYILLSLLVLTLSVSLFFKHIDEAINSTLSWDLSAYYYDTIIAISVLCGLVSSLYLMYQFIILMYRIIVDQNAKTKMKGIKLK